MPVLTFNASCRSNLECASPLGYINCPFFNNLRIFLYRLKDIVRIVDICPDIITANIKDDLASVFEFLTEDLGVADEHFHLVLNKCPRILAASAR